MIYFVFSISLISFLALVVLFIISISISFKFIRPEMRNTTEANEIIFSETNFNPVSFEAASDFGYMLNGEYIDSNSSNCVIFVHGLSTERSGMYKYLQIFLKNSWNIVLYDQRNHGLTDGNLTSFGFYEKHDLVKIIQWSKLRFPECTNFLLFSESMGAAVALQVLSLGEPVSGVVADSSFSSLDALIKYHTEIIFKNKLLSVIIFHMVKMLIYIQAGFKTDEISPETSVAASETPILFFHGTGDKSVPSYMSMKMSRMNKNSELCLIECNNHACEIYSDKDNYNLHLAEFITKNLGIGFNR